MSTTMYVLYVFKNCNGIQHIRFALTEQTMRSVSNTEFRHDYHAEFFIFVAHCGNFGFRV